MIPTSLPKPLQSRLWRHARHHSVRLDEAYRQLLIFALDVLDGEARAEPRGADEVSTEFVSADLAGPAHGDGLQGRLPTPGRAAPVPRAGGAGR